MIALLVWTAGSAALLATALAVHTRVRGFLPEDPPGPGRKRHPRPTPMAGSLPAAVSIAGLALAGLPWTAAGVALATVVGLWDDVRKDRGRADGVRWELKGVGLLAAAACATADVAPLAGGGVAAVLATALALFVLTNATNFLDNQDGVATGLGVTALLVVGGGAADSAATLLGGVWLAFLPFNWPRARLFLGDGGAYPLGLAAATLAWRAAATPDGIALLPALAPLAVFALDFAQVVAARLALGYAPWIADRRHLTHVLLARGVPRVALAPLLVTFALAAGLLIRP